jgi:hypothetical protein
VLSVHGLPALRQPPVASAPHVPLLHVPLQQEAADWQGMPSGVHAATLHRPPTQESEQHSVAAMQG